MSKLMVGVVVWSLAAASLVTWAEEKPIVDSKTTYAKEALSKFVDSGELTGVISIFYRDGVQETCCLGYADGKTKRPITLDDPFMQCSQTKGFCGVTMAKLIEEGKVSLDDPVSKYLPEFGQLYVRKDVDKETGNCRLERATHVLTVRMVMNHTGGFPFEVPNFQAMGGWSRRMPIRSTAMIAASLPLQFEPGTGIQYSNLGIEIGAAIIEKVTGERWENYLKKTVLDPLGMTKTWFWPTDEQVANKIEMHVFVPGQKASWQKDYPSMRSPYNDDRVFPSAGAGLWTTTRDQIKFYKMLMNLGVGENGVRILKEETVRKYLAVSTRPEEFDGYSMGLSAPKQDDENGWIGHGGAWRTNCSVNWHKKEMRVFIVQLLSPDWNFAPLEKAIDGAADKFFKAKLNASGVNAYTGRVN